MVAFVLSSWPGVSPFPVVTTRAVLAQSAVAVPDSGAVGAPERGLREADTIRFARRARPRLGQWTRVAFVFVAVTTGGLERLWVETHSLGTLTSDGSVIGLMALDLIHHGQLPAYMWGQSYGGSVEAIMTAAVFTLAGVGTAQLLATTALSSALATLALWRAGRWIVGEPAATIGALAFWVWPASVMWRSLKPGGTYMIGLALALCAVGALARLRHDSQGWTRPAVAGGWCGLAFWASPMSLQLLIPAALWCTPVFVRMGRRMFGLGAGALVGALPVFIFGSSHHWSNLHMPGNGAMLSGAVGRMAQFFRVEAPIAMSLRVEGSLSWVEGPFGIVLALAAWAGVVTLIIFVVAGRARRCQLPALTLVLLPILFSLNVMADHVGQGRYVMFGSTMGALLIGVGLENVGRFTLRTRAWWKRRGDLPAARSQPGIRFSPPPVLWPFGLVLLAVLGAVALAREPASALATFPAPDVPMPMDDGGLRALLSKHHIHDAYTNYWIAYRITFETNETTIAVPYDYDRYPPLSRLVRDSRDPCYLFVSTSDSVTRFEKWCHEKGIALQIWSSGGFTVLQPPLKVLPSQLPGGVLT